MKNYIGIRTATLRPNVELKFDIYLKISEKHLLYVRRDEDIEAERLNRLHYKNVRQVFIREKDRAAYEEFLAESAISAVNDTSLPLRTRAMIINGQSRAAVEEMFANADSERNYMRIKGAAANQVALLMKTPEVLEYLIKVAQHDRSTYQHCVNVATIAVGLASGLGASEQTCNVIGTGALLHDIGKNLNAAASEVDLQHPRMGAQLLIKKKYVSKDVLDIIVLHEERLDGRGYPSGVKKLDQIFQVVGLANTYDRQVTFMDTPPREVHRLIATLKPLPYEEELIDGLKDVLVSNKLY